MTPEGVGRQPVDENGKSMAGNFEDQGRVIFGNIVAVVKRAGGSFKGVVSITVRLTGPSVITFTPNAKAARENRTASCLPPINLNGLPHGDSDSRGSHFRTSPTHPAPWLFPR
jgi:hypothetical protein